MRHFTRTMRHASKSSHRMSCLPNPQPSLSPHPREPQQPHRPDRLTSPDDRCRLTPAAPSGTPVRVPEPCARQPCSSSPTRERRDALDDRTRPRVSRHLAHLTTERIDEALQASGGSLTVGGREARGRARSTLYPGPPRSRRCSRPGTRSLEVSSTRLRPPLSRRCAGATSCGDVRPADARPP